MSIRIRPFIRPALLALVLFGMPALTLAQREGLLSGNIKYNSGQTVQPIFEGWTRNADGRYQFFFGYLNRNHAEEVQVPVGVENRIEPGGPDRGQPSYFYTRFNRQLFSVTVPSDWGKKELIWTLVTRGQTERAVAWLRPDWEIAPPGNPAASGRGGGDTKNQPPTLALAAQPRIALPATLSLTATVTDDGLPAGRGGGARGAAGAGAAGGAGAARGAGAAGGAGGAGAAGGARGAAAARGNANRPPAFDNSEFKATTPINVPQVERPAPPRATGRLQVVWSVWRGPGPVTFTPPAAAADEGPAVVTATFVRPGEYVLRARATDSAATTLQDIIVVVGPQE